MIFSTRLSNQAPRRDLPKFMDESIEVDSNLQLKQTGEVKHRALGRTLAVLLSRAKYLIAFARCDHAFLEIIFLGRSTSLKGCDLILQSTKVCQWRHNFVTKPKYGFTNHCINSCNDRSPPQTRKGAKTGGDQQSLLRLCACCGKKFLPNRLESALHKPARQVFVQSPSSLVGCRR
jgi:hypothetical protein